jgi:predicted nucleic acid-binding protein
MPMATALGTLDAIHLATALLYREQQSPDERPIAFATHDAQLARAAKSLQFDVIGT